MAARIFISYSKLTPEPTIALTALLERHGYSVWWDKNLTSGESFRDAIERELDTSDAVIVIWTDQSTKSNWVIAEADHAARMNKLITVRTSDLAPIRIPKPFATLHTDLVDDAPAVLGSVAKKLMARNPVMPETQPIKLRFNPRRTFIIGFSIAVAALLWLAPYIFREDDSTQAHTKRLAMHRSEFSRMIDEILQRKFRPPPDRPSATEAERIEFTLDQLSQASAKIQKSLASILPSNPKCEQSEVICKRLEKEAELSEGRRISLIAGELSAKFQSEREIDYRSVEVRHRADDPPEIALRVEDGWIKLGPRTRWFDTRSLVEQELKCRNQPKDLQALKELIGIAPTPGLSEADRLRDAHSLLSSIYYGGCHWRSYTYANKNSHHYSRVSPPSPQLVRDLKAVVAAMEGRNNLPEFVAALIGIIDLYPPEDLMKQLLDYRFNYNPYYHANLFKSLGVKNR